MRERINSEIIREVSGPIGIPIVWLLLIDLEKVSILSCHVPANVPAVYAALAVGLPRTAQGIE